MAHQLFSDPLLFMKDGSDLLSSSIIWPAISRRVSSRFLPVISELFFGFFPVTVGCSGVQTLVLIKSENVKH